MRLARPKASFSGDPLEALVDTGADGTIVPTQHLRPLGGQIDDQKYLRTPWGERRRVFTYLLDVEVAGRRLLLVEVVGDDEGDELIVGRNILNRLVLTLDGPRGVLEIRG